MIVRWPFIALMFLTVAVAMACPQWAAAQRPTAEAQPAPDAEQLDRLLDSYFRSRSSKRRKELARSIDAEADGDFNAVAQALTRVQVWDAFPGPMGWVSIPSETGPQQIGSYQLPDAYDARRPHPMIVCMPGKAYMSGIVMDTALAMLGPAAQDAVLICAHWPDADRFHQSGQRSTYLNILLSHARRRFHIDTDRAYLFGVDGGADAAWMTAFAQAHQFAGVVAVSGYPSLPYPEVSYRFMLKNLAHTPVLTVWGRPAEDVPGTRDATVALHNRRIAALAGKHDLPITAIERDSPLPRDAAGDVRPEVLPQDDVNRVLSHRRKFAARRVSHWFRYPAHGNTRWLAQTDFKGHALSAEQIAILPSAGVDRSAFIGDVLQDKLAYLGARVDGRTIDIRTRRCARIEVLLTPELIDPRRPLTMRVNGLRRHTGPVEPDIAVLLETAYREWDFTHPAAARLTFSIRTDGEPFAHAP